MAVQGTAALPVPGCAAICVRPPGDLGYWSVRDGAYELVPAADTYLRFLRYGRGRALGTTEKYAGNLAVFFDWCATRGLGLSDAARRLDEFVLLLRNEPVTRPGSRCGQVAAGGADQSHAGFGAGDVQVGGRARLVRRGHDRGVVRDGRGA